MKNSSPPKNLPKFAIGQKILHRWVINDPPDPLHGQVVEYIGTIWGISWHHPEYLGDGWFYAILFDSTTHPEDTSLPVWAVIHEKGGLSAV